jgi:hypothetical protein
MSLSYYVGAQANVAVAVKVAATVLLIVPELNAITFQELLA